MRRLLFQAVFLAAGMIVGVYASGDVGPGLVCGALVAVCCAAVGEYAGGSCLTAAMLVIFDCMTCLVPSWYLMLPIAAFNAASLPETDGRPLFVTSRWLWLVPMVVSPLCSGFTAMVVAMTALLTILGFAVGLLCAREARLAGEVRRLQDSRRDQIRRLRSRLAENGEDRALAVRAATLAERTRIAREIHDNVGHMLTRAIMQTEAAQVVAQVSGQEQSARQFAEIHDTVGEAMTLVRKAVHDLKDEGTDFASQIAAAAHSMDDTGELQVRLDNGIESAPAAVARCFATAIREALNNTISHSQARNVSIVLRDFPALWQLCVQDDGANRTFTAETAATRIIRPGDSTGIGISDIEERARALGGSSVCGPYHEGWRVFVSIPRPTPKPAKEENARVRKGER
ncbi:sensor histidine kinase [Bifidobacterium ruminantium]|uniref:sensor histidine kinase n=1 Tax=Bifidobacterium ruminantium TaxID=78346 RepID=UPI00255CEA92|nr:histidine kinase [Bifidobacterium ruminantium]